MCDHCVLLQQPVPLPFWLPFLVLQLTAAVIPCSKEEYHILSWFYLLGSLSHSSFNQLKIFKKKFKLSSICCPGSYEPSNSSLCTLMPHTSETVWFNEQRNQETWILIIVLLNHVHCVAFLSNNVFPVDSFKDRFYPQKFWWSCKLVWLYALLMQHFP